MIAGKSPASAAIVMSSWRRLRYAEFWLPLADAFAVLTVFTLPWSTSLTGIFAACWLGAGAFVVNYPAYFRSLKHPIFAFPLALFGLIVAGTLWSEASWPDRIRGISPGLKLLFLPGLFHHFARSTRGMWVFAAFLASCTLLMLISWLVVLEPSLSLKDVVRTSAYYEPERGIFVKNYIAQSQEFALCAIALSYPILVFFRDGKTRQALLLSAIALGLLANMAFVNVSRTAMVTLPVMLGVFAFLHLRPRTSVMIFCAAALFAALAFVASPHLRNKADLFLRDYRLYAEQDEPTSIGLRLEYWRKSLRFFSEAPLIGHGTGSMRQLFEQAVLGPEKSASAQIVSNPHNQALNVAVQWGIVGVAALFAMWLAHLLLFRGEGMAAWIGLLVVVQNFCTSLFNSHLFDFHEGWMYVLGVGVAGGIILQQRARQSVEGR